MKDAHINAVMKSQEDALREFLSYLLLNVI